ncbi:MAG: substrate-binding domain-containing protein [Anaerolineae bacterium]
MLRVACSVALCPLLLIAVLLSGCVPFGSKTVAGRPSRAANGEPAPVSAPPGLPASASERPASAGKLILATTTSTADSGLLDYLLPDFEQRFNCKVEVIAAGSGQAIKTGEAGDCDVLLLHARTAEDKFVADGQGINRQDVMYNDFCIVGPASDPAAIGGTGDGAAALAKIAAAEVPFVSRGDESGTHAKEKELWAKAGIAPTGAWYISAGQGMGAVLTMASELQGYTLSDRATFLSQRDKLELVILVEGDKALFNPYGVIEVNPTKHPSVNHALAHQFVEWLISAETQERIATFGREQFGQSLFIPDSAAWREAHPTP